MELETFQYSPGRGWSPELRADLDSERSVVLVFGAADLHDNPAPLRQLFQCFPAARVLGCSTSGEIYGGAVYDGTLSAAVLRLRSAAVRTASAAIHRIEDSYPAGVAIAQQLLRPDADGLKGVIVLCDGLNVNGSELVRSLNDSLPESVRISGGLAGDGDRFARTWVIIKDGTDACIASGHVTALGLYGDSVRLSHGSEGGWDNFGPERQVTRSRGNVLYELDGKPALELYRRYLGDLASGLPATGLFYPLALRRGPEEPRWLVRTILAVDEEAQSLTFAGDIPTGWRARLMKANLDRLVDGASLAAAQIAQREAPRLSIGQGLPAAASGPGLLLAMSCVGRRLVLGERCDEEVAATLAGLPPRTRQIGFYSYGAITPIERGACGLHNQTMTLTHLSAG